jgi:hypothetical protein
MDISLKLNSISLAVIQTFSPARLFAAGEQGAWYDPSDLNTLFQDQAGTTPVTAVEQPVSLMLDKSKGLVLGSELVTNGTFDTDITGWTAYNSTVAWDSGGGGRAKITATASSSFIISSAITTVVGRFYNFTATFTKGSPFVGSDSAFLGVSNNSNGGSAYFTTTQTGVGEGTITAYFAATATTTYVYTRWSTAATNDVWYVDNISVKELPGNHAYTPSTATASRPVLSARVNLLTKTEQFNDGAWSKSRLDITTNAATAPDGTLTAENAVPTTVSGSHVVTQATSNSPSTVTMSVYAKANGYTKIALLDGLSTAAYATWDLATASLLSSGTIDSGSAVNPTIEPLANGWFKLSVTIVPTNTTNKRLDIYVLNPTYTSGNPTSNWTGNGTDGILIWGADLRVANDGVGIPNYQRVNTSTDYDTVGFPLYLRCDGTDDYMLTNSIDFTATDKMTVWTGVRKLSDAAQGMFSELSASANTNSGSFYLAAPDAAAPNVRFRGGGTLSVSTSLTDSAAAPISGIATCIGNISGPSLSGRWNGVAGSTNTNSQGTGNYGNHQLYLFRRGGTTLPFNGRCYGLIVRGAQSSTAQIQQGEAYMNSLTKAY